MCTAIVLLRGRSHHGPRDPNRGARRQGDPYRRATPSPEILGGRLGVSPMRRLPRPVDAGPVNRTPNIAIAAALAALLVLVSAAPASATFQGALGQLAYWKDEPLASGAQQHKIFLDDPSDDQPPRQLTAGYAAAWSPDGTQIAFEVNDLAATDTRSTEGIAVLGADGTGRRQLVFTPPREPSPFTSWTDHHPAWSADGESIFYLRARGRSVASSGDQDQVQLRKVSLSGGDGLVKAYDIQRTGLRGLVASPDGTKLLSVRAENVGSSFESNAVILDAETGAMSTVPGTSGASGVDFAPDSKRIVVTTATGAGIVAKVIRLEDNRVLQTFTGLGSVNTRFSPDGSYLLLQEGCGTGVGATCTLVARLLDDPDADIPPYVPREKVLGTVHRNEVDVQPQTQPIIFLHGFAGSRIACGSDELWPPTPFSGEDLLDMRLAEDGLSMHRDACPAQPSAIVDTAYGADIYESALEYLAEIRPDDHHVFVWDWRRDPRLQMQALNAMVSDALQGELQRKQGVTKVVLMAHSMGGLVARKYIDDPGLAKRVSRVVTIGTPYWGSPKALLPLALGISMPGGADPLDHLLADGPLREMFRNLTGGYFLYPSEKYGPWLTVDGRTPTPFDRTALVDYVSGPLGGNGALLSKALDAHRDELDGFKLNGVDYRAYVGTGLSTIGSVRLIPGAAGGEDELQIGWVNGDITVPGRSGSQGPLGTTDPFGEDVAISYVCNVEHVPLPGHPSVTTPIRDFLRFGTQPRKTEDICLNEGKEVRFKGVDLPDDQPAPGLAAAASADNPGLQLIRLPGQPIAVTDNDFPADLTVQADGARLAVTPLSGETRGTPVYYGPITGELSLKTGVGGAVTVLDDGAPVPARTTREPGDPGAPAGTPPPDDDGDGPGGGSDGPGGGSDGPGGGSDGPGGGNEPGGGADQPGGHTEQPGGGTAPTASTPRAGADTDPPETAMAKKPKRHVRTKAKRARAAFSFRADEPGARFECKLDRGAFKPCSSTLTLKAKPGRHTLLVRAVDSAGNADPTPATWAWRVKRAR
jgi:PGAP1-like protein/WD40-like Beta Propeller Repeat